MRIWMTSLVATAFCANCTLLAAQGSGNGTAGSNAGAGRAGGSNGSATSIGVRIGTLGIGAELSQMLGGHFGLRVGGNYFKVNRQATQQDVTYDATAKLQSYSGILDWYPARRGTFHFSAGAISNPVSVDGVGVPEANATYTINNRDYTSAQVGTYTGSAEYASVLPYVGLGFGTPAAKSRGIGVVFDIGAAIGKPTVLLRSSNEGTNAALAVDMRAENAKVQDSANKLPVFPVVSLGLTYRF